MKWILLVVASSLGSLATTALVRRYALARSMMDVPNARSSHHVAVPRGGGVGIILPVLICLLALPLAGTPWPLALSGSAALLLVAVLGWVDDSRSLSVRVRLVGHLLAGAMVALTGRSVDLGGFGSSAPEAVLWIWWIFWTVSVINVANFIDGIDGIMGLQAIVFASFAFVAAGTDGAPAAVVALTLVGAAAGFLVLNWAPAKVFMGDVGSGSLGLIFVLLGILTMREVGWTVIHAFLPLMIIFADEVLTMNRRIRRGERLSTPHRTHVYQLLVQAGVSHSRVALLYGLMAVAPAVWANLHPEAEPVFWVGVAAALITAFGLLTVLRGWAERRLPAPAVPST